MKSIKPGRGPSKMGEVMSVAVAIFGVLWCILALCGGAWFMVPFGVIFVGVAIYQARYHRHNAEDEERYSIVDIVDGDEEPDPLNRRYGSAAQPEDRDDRGTTGGAFCPYCGAIVQPDFAFCPQCGRKLRQ